MCATIQSQDSEMLRAYLSAHDEPCPACGHNVRGVTSGRCPECGRSLSIGIRASSMGFARRWGLLLLVFMWLLVAANAYVIGGLP